MRDREARATGEPMAHRVAAARVLTPFSTRNFQRRRAQRQAHARGVFDDRAVELAFDDPSSATATTARPRSSRSRRSRRRRRSPARDPSAPADREAEVPERPRIVPRSAACGHGHVHVQLTNLPKLWRISPMILRFGITTRERSVCRSVVDDSSIGDHALDAEQRDVLADAERLREDDGQPAMRLLSTPCRAKPTPRRRRRCPR